MRITKDGEVHVSVPWGVPRLVVERFIDDHREWIEQARLRTLQRQQQRDSFYARLPLTTRAQKQEATRRLLPLKSKWGHCLVRTRTICLSTYLLLLPEWCIEHVVVHEMCHLLQSGHGPRFHALMDRFYPNWRAANKETTRLLRS